MTNDHEKNVIHLDFIRDTLQNDVKELGFILSERQLEQFCLYANLLLQWNEKMNLTAIKDPIEICKKHFIDSLCLVKTKLLDKSNSLIDVGTGAGFPGIPLKIVFPDINITLLDSLKKRVAFLEEVIDNLQLHHISAFHGRAEEFGKWEEHREQYDICVSRAVASLPTLLECGIPFVKIGGFFVAYKSEKIYEELNGIEKLVDLLGGTTKTRLEFTLPNTQIKRTFFIVEKSSPTLVKYPRKPGIPFKNPLNSTFLQ
jgi:16S rRNA (guanine527-N7)-methyltransferase